MQRSATWFFLMSNLAAHSKALGICQFRIYIQRICLGCSFWKETTVMYVFTPMTVTNLISQPVLCKRSNNVPRRSASEVQASAGCKRRETSPDRSKTYIYTEDEFRICKFQINYHAQQ